MKKVSFLLFLAFLTLFVSCRIDRPEGISTYLISADLKESKQNIKSRSLNNDYITTPFHFTGKLLRLDFHSDSAISNEGYFPADIWRLRGSEGDSPNEEECYNDIGTVFFDLKEKQEVSGGLAKPPQKTGFGIYRSLRLEYTYVDVGFEFDGQECFVRICTSSWDGCTRGDLMMKDADGNFKWISKGGDPDTLLADRPQDPVINSYLASWASAWAVDDYTATIFGSEAHIPEQYLFDVPSFLGSYEITLDFRLTDSIVLKDIDPLNYTKQDILEKLDLWTFVGKGPEHHIVVIPTVVEY